MPSLRATASRRAAVVAGQHDDAHAVARAAPRCASAALSLIGSATAMSPASCAVDRRRTSRVWPVGAQLRRPRRRDGAAIDPELRQQRRVAERDLPAVDRAGDALAGVRLEVARLGGSAMPRSSAPATIAAASGCSLPRSSAGGEPQHLGFLDAVGGHDRDQLRLALGQRAGLVDDQRVDLLQQLERFGVPDQDAGRARRGRCRP